MSNVAMYCRQAKLKLPVKSIMEEFKSGKVRLQMMLDDSKDKVIKSLSLVRGVCNLVISVDCSLNYSHHKYNTKHYNRAKEME